MKCTAGASPKAETGDRQPLYRLRLFVAGNEPNSLQARRNLAHLCATILRDRCVVMIVDVLQDYQAAIDYQVMAVPTLMIEAPPPTKIIVGSLSDESKVLAALGLSEKGGGR